MNLTTNTKELNMNELRGSFQNRIMEGGLYSTDLDVKVGTPATLTGYTDRDPATVIKIEEKKNYRLIYVQEDDYIAKHKDIYEGQEWVYKRNPNGRISMFKEQLITATRERRTYLVSFKNKKTGEICDFQQIDRNDIDFSLKGFKSKEEFLKEWSWVDGSFRRSGTIVDVVERLKYTSVVKSKKSNRLVKKGYGGVILGKREKYYDLSF